MEEVVGKMRNCGMRNAESKMRNRKCGMTLIGRTVKPRDHCHSAYYLCYCNDVTNRQSGKMRNAENANIEATVRS